MWAGSVGQQCGPASGCTVRQCSGAKTGQGPNERCTDQQSKTVATSSRVGWLSSWQHRACSPARPATASRGAESVCSDGRRGLQSWPCSEAKSRQRRNHCPRPPQRAEKAGSAQGRCRLLPRPLRWLLHRWQRCRCWPAQAAPARVSSSTTTVPQRRSSIPRSTRLSRSSEPEAVLQMPWAPSRRRRCRTKSPCRISSLPAPMLRAIRSTAKDRRMPAPRGRARGNGLL